MAPLGKLGSGRAKPSLALPYPLGYNSLVIEVRQTFSEEFLTYRQLLMNPMLSSLKMLILRSEVMKRILLTY